MKCQNKNRYPLVIKGNIEKNNAINNNHIKIPSLNLLLKQSNSGTFECDQTKRSEISEKNFINSKSNDFSSRRTNNQKPFFVPQGQGSLTLEKEENNSYCSYFCFKSK